eukprot:2399348-Pyramimonas_sp.AAC.1
MDQSRCSFRDSRATALGSRPHRFCALICTSNLDQSGKPRTSSGATRRWRWRWITSLLSHTSGRYSWQSSVVVRAARLCSMSAYCNVVDAGACSRPSSEAKLQSR